VTLDQLRGDAFDRAFLEGMLLHHAIAVVMTRPVARRGEHTELRAMARAIIDVHLREITQRRGWLREWYGVDVPDPLADERTSFIREAAAHDGLLVLKTSAAADAPSGAPELPMGRMSTLADLWRLPESRLDAVYMSLMIPHHLGAIEMTKLAPERANRAQVKEFALAVERLQSRVVVQMQRWLAEWYRL
jgi:uncharacterized protein (DUF305 family)